MTCLCIRDKRVKHEERAYNKSTSPTKYCILLPGNSCVYYYSKRAVCVVHGVWNLMHLQRNPTNQHWKHVDEDYSSIGQIVVCYLALGNLLLASAFWLVRLFRTQLELSIARLESITTFLFLQEDWRSSFSISSSSSGSLSTSLRSSLSSWRLQESNWHQYLIFYIADKKSL